MFKAGDSFLRLVLRVYFSKDTFYFILKVALAYKQVSYIYSYKCSIINIPKVILNIGLHLVRCFSLYVQVGCEDLVLVVGYVMPIAIEIYVCEEGGELRVLRHLLLTLF